MLTKFVCYFVWICIQMKMLLVLWLCYTYILPVTKACLSVRFLAYQSPPRYMYYESEWNPLLAVADVLSNRA